MPLIYTEDRAYLFAIDDHNDIRNGVPQSVFYHVLPDGSLEVVADRHSYEAGRVMPPSPVEPPPQPVEPPSPVEPPQPPPLSPIVNPPSLIPVTREGDGNLINRGYAYYSQAWIGPSGTIYVFAGVRESLPQFWSIDRLGNVTRMGSLVSVPGEAEGWYWDREGWIYLTDGARLRRINPFTRAEAVVLDITASHPNHNLWQAHSSVDGSTHSASVTQVVSMGKYPAVGTIVFRNGFVRYFEKEGNELDESILSADGRFLIIQEDNNNRVIDLDTGEVRRFADQDGALAHIDTGPSYMVGESDKPDPGCCAYYDLLLPLELAFRRVMFPTTNMGHVSVKGGRCVNADAWSIYLVNLVTREKSWLIDHGMHGSSYDYQCMANLDPTGRVVTYLSNAAGRFDLYVLVL